MDLALDYYGYKHNRGGGIRQPILQTSPVSTAPRVFFYRADLLVGGARIVEVDKSIPRREQTLTCLKLPILLDIPDPLAAVRVAKLWLQCMRRWQW